MVELRSSVVRVLHQGALVALLVRASPVPAATEFYTPEDAELQVGRVVHSADDVVAPHRHEASVRTVSGCTEVLNVQRGRMIVDLYTKEGVIHDSLQLGDGDTLIILGAGHGVRFLEDTTLLEVKQGPYTRSLDKELL